MTTDFYCQECTSTHILPDRHGYYVCRDCGLVVDIPVIQDSLSKLHTAKNGQILHENAIIVDAGTSIGTEQERHLLPLYRHLHRAQKMVVKHPKTRAFSIFSQLKAKFEVALDTRILFNRFEKYYPKLQSGSKARNITLLCSTLFYLTCRNHAIKLNLKPVLSTYGFSKRDYFAVASRLEKLDPKFRQTSLNQLQRNVFTHISHLYEKFQFPKTIIPITQYLVKHYRPFLGEKAEIIAGAAVGLALKIANPPKKPTNFQISKALSVTASTIYNRVRFFKLNRISPRVISQMKQVGAGQSGPSKVIKSMNLQSHPIIQG